MKINSDTTDRTRTAVGGSGRAYLPFQPKAISGAPPAPPAVLPVWWMIDVNAVIGGGVSS